MSFLFFALLLPSQLVAIEKPNVIVILTDDQGWGDLSLHGNPNLSTPRIDSLARDGAHIRHFYVCPVCSPTRAEFLTGRYHTRMGVYSTSAGQFPYHPNARGFQEFYGFCSGHWGHYFSPMLEHNGKIVQGEGFIVDDLTNRAMKFIDDNRDEPFFIYLPYNTPHSPMQVPDKYWDRFKDKEIVPDPSPRNQKKVSLPHTRAALAMCENIDDNVGRLLDHLDETKLSDNTIVVYFCDNGPNGKRFNGGLRGRKGATHEGGVRSPCLLRYPKHIKPNTTVQQISASIDLLPTLADFAGIEFESPKPLDGVSIRSCLEGGSESSDRLLFSAWNRRATVRSQRFRMHHTGELFDLQSDPGEQNDIAADQPQEASLLGKALESWQKQNPLQPSNTKESRAFPLGHPDAQWTQLPARDAIPGGKITRSNRYPNCTFMQNWSDTESTIEWDVDVLAAGVFEVQMYYSCAQKDVGSTINLTCGDSSIRAQITEANDVPLIGDQEDRFERVEGYVRRWKPMSLGKMSLQAGRQQLVLRAEKIVGEEVANMRLLMFRRVDGD